MVLRHRLSKLYKLINVSLLFVLVSGVLQPVAAQAYPATAPVTTASTDQTTVVVKMKASANVDISNNAFVGPNQADANQLNTVLAPSKTNHKQRLLSEDKQTARTRRSQLAKSLRSDQGNLEDYYSIKLDAGEKADDVAKQLKKVSSVETAYAKPLPAPAPTANFAPYQGYFRAAPNGFGINATIGGTASTTPFPGTDGSKVKVADLEYSWNTNHEDLSKLRASGALWANGTPSDPFADTNHGTAVAGIIAANKNGSGVDGIVPNVEYHMVNTVNTERGWDVANSIYTAANKMSQGDVILIEQQAWAPDNQGYAPMETYQDVYDAITYATAKGINVIEPAGNGKQDYWQGYDLSDPMFNGIFTNARANSGAVIVGAGSGGCSPITPIRSRLGYSNFGARIDVQGEGECFITTGYGDVSAANPNATYTANFGGTSSASAMISGITAELSSSYKQSNKLTAMTPASLKAALINGSSPQNTTINPGKIGGLPNLATALRLTDTVAPTTPTLFTAKSTGTNQISLNWTKSTDNLGYIQYYLIYRNNVWVGATNGTTATYVDTSIRDKVNYSYKVTAFDYSGNLSAATPNISVLNK